MDKGKAPARDRVQDGPMTYNGTRRSLRRNGAVHQRPVYVAFLTQWSARSTQSCACGRCTPKVRTPPDADAFVRRKKYDVPVFQSRHPGLNEYIGTSVRAIAHEVQNVRRGAHAVVCAHGRRRFAL